MKHAAVFVLVFFCASAWAQQTTNVFSIFPEHPTAGGTVTVTYDPSSPAAKLKDADQLELYALVFRSGDDPLFLDLPMKKEGNKWTAATPIADKNSSYMIFRCVSRDQSDDNGDNGFDAMVYGDDGKPVVGAHQYRAMAMDVGQINSFKRSKDVVKAKEEINEEMQLYPQNWRGWNQYLTILNREDRSDEGMAKLKPEIDRFSAACKDNEEALSKIVDWYRIAGDSAKADLIERETIAAKPNGDFASQARWYHISKEQDPANRVGLIQQYLQDHPDIEKRDLKNKLFSLYNAYGATKDYDKAAEILSRIENRSWQWWNGFAWGLIEKGQNLEKAVGWARRGVDLSRTPDADSKKYYSTPKEWEKSNKYATGAVLDTYAYGLFQLGKTDEAEKSYAEAYELMAGGDIDVNTRYMESMIRNGHFDKAYEVGVECVKNSKSNDKLVDQVKLAFAGKEGSPADFAKLSLEKQKAFNNLMAATGKSRSETARKKVLESRISKPSIDFTLNDLSGNPVTLSSLKGKVVVIDFWATWCGPCRASFPYLQKVHEKYKNNEKVVFLAVDTWERQKDLASTMENAKKFMADNKYTFQVVIDQITGKKVSDKYEVEGIPTKFIIDKKGNLAFRSVGFSGPDMEDELITQIEVLLGDTIGSLR